MLISQTSIKIQNCISHKYLHSCITLCQLQATMKCVCLFFSSFFSFSFFFFFSFFIWVPFSHVNCLLTWTILYHRVYMWPSTGKLGTTRHPSKKFFLHLQNCRRLDIELSKFYRCSLSRSHYNRLNRSLPSAWHNTFLRNRSIFSRYLRTPRCARFSRRRSHIFWGYSCLYVSYHIIAWIFD